VWVLGSKLIVLQYRAGYNLDNALKEFQNRLSEKQKNEFESLASTSPRTEDLSDFINEINKNNSTRKSRRWADRIKTTIEPIHQYCAVIETLIQSDPGVAALVWGCTKFVILVFKNPSIARLKGNIDSAGISRLPPTSLNTSKSCPKGSTTSVTSFPGCGNMRRSSATPVGCSRQCQHSMPLLLYSLQNHWRFCKNEVFRAPANWHIEMTMH
jgi:hypothetical protein